MDAEAAVAKQFFETYHVPLSDFWLESCITWFKEQNSGTNYTTKELHTKVYEQWLLLDLRDVEVPQLLPSILQEKKIVLNRHFSLQMLSVIDISKPKLWQLQKIRKSNLLVEQEGEIVSSKRMLQLSLTDGIHEIKATEYKPIPSLNINLTPGVKIQIIPPITIRRGQIMLEQHNVKLLGGEVEEIQVSHAAENVLARALNLPENLNPKSVEEAATQADATVIDNASVLNTSTNQYSNPANVRQVQTSINSSVKRNNQHGISDEEELRIAAEVDMLLETEKELMAPPNRSHTPDMFDDVDFNAEDFDNFDIVSKTEKKGIVKVEERKSENFNAVKFNKQVVIPKTIKVKKMESEAVSERETMLSTTKMQGFNKVIKPEDILQDEEDLFEELDIEEIINKSQDKISISLNELADKIDAKLKGKFKVHAKFKSIIQKLSIEGGWTIQIAITDESDDLIVSMHSDVISDLFGFRPSDIEKLKSDIQHKNQEAIEIIMKAMNGFKEKLLSLDCVMEIEVTEGDEVSTIIKLL